MSKTYMAVSYEPDDPPHPMRSAVVTKKLITLEWEEGDYLVGLSATSTDGALYEGTYEYRGYPDEI